MRLFKVLSALCLCILLLTGCNNTVQKNSNRPETSANMTGFPSDTVQRECLYVNGVLYLYDCKWDGDMQGSGYTYYGDIKSEDVYHTPSADLTSAWVDVGSKVYVHPEDKSSIVVEEGGTLSKYTAGML